MDESPIDLDPKSMYKQDDIQPNDQKLKQKLQDLDDNQPEDLKMKQEVQDLHSSHPVPKIAIIPSSDPSMESLKLIEEIVRIYGDHVNHVILEAKYGIKDEQISNVDRTKCGGLGETFAQKIKRLGCELERMKNDENQFKNYYMFIEPRVTQIMSQLLMIHQLFDPSSKSRALSCAKEELRSCETHEMDQLRKEVFAITLRIKELKTLQIYRKTMEARQRYFRI